MKQIITFIIMLAVVPSIVYSDDDDVHWDYQGQHGPEHWGELASDFDICGSGKNQSPIDLVADMTGDLPALEFEYLQAGSLIEVNTGHAIQENVQPGNYLRYLDQRFELKQFHFHSPSEHTVNGEYFPMEVHFVHQNEKDKYLVVALMFLQGKHNESMDQLPSFRAARGEAPLSEPVDYNELIKNRDNYFLYNGSLTTPPCTEGVQWIILKSPIVASGDQIQHYHDLLGFDNNRPIQPHNARIILD